ncbi:hypothetical protein N7470_000200 [Penicillium chermesinum]|nr:hypothetical protein N7470_000200 [Penicillium chermesinum]
MNTMEKKTQKRSSSVQRAPSRSRDLYDPKGSPSTRSVATQKRSSSTSRSDRVQHPTLTRVKGRINMYTPPRNRAEMSWLNDQSPVQSGVRTPSEQYSATHHRPDDKADANPRHSVGTPESGTPTLVNPTSSLLQDLLKEERAQRGSRGAPSEHSVDSAPHTPERGRSQGETGLEKGRKASEVSTAMSRAPPEMGMREMDQYVSKMTKLNFDLKLEIFHRTQQVGILEKKVQRMEEMEEELQRLRKLEEEVVELRDCHKRNSELEAKNQKLQHDLSTKDKAISEAVEWICKLEAENDRLKMSSQASQISLNRQVLDGPNASPLSRASIDIPQRRSSRRGMAAMTSPRPDSSDSRHLSVVPSFLRSDNRSTATLRSLYAPDTNKSHSALSQLTNTESFHSMNEAIEPESPRLSVLSECSELNPFDTPSRQDGFDKLKIPIRKASSIAASAVSSTLEQEESKDTRIDRWMQAPAEFPDTVIRKRQHRSMSEASRHDLPVLVQDLYSNKPRGRPRLDTSLFGGAKLPPTPDTMSTAYVAAHNGSDGSIAADKSPKFDHHQWFSTRPLERRRSADEVATQRSFNGSDITNSMQTNCSDTPRLGAESQSPTIFPFNTVAPKASALLGPGSPNNPIPDPFVERRADRPGQEYHDITTPVQSPTKIVTAQPQADCDSPPLTPQDWIAAAKEGPRSRKTAGLRIEAQLSQPRRNVLTQAAFHDDDSIASWSTEAEVPGVPTLDMATLDMLEQPIPELAPVPEVQDDAGPDQRRRLSFRPPFFSRSSHSSRRLHSSPVPQDFDDDGDAPRRPLSQIITNSNELYSSSLPTSHFESNLDGFDGSRSLQQPFPEARGEIREIGIPTHSATMAVRPTTSQSGDHKRRSSLGIFGWMKGVSGKRSEPNTPAVSDKFSETIHQELRAPRLKHEQSFSTVRAPTPDSMHSPSRSRPETSGPADDPSRRPRYMGRRSRRLQ